MTGGLLVLAAYGAQDKYITGNPQITFFVAVYRRYTNFSIIQTSQYFTGDFDFGKKIYCKIDRIGDFLFAPKYNDSIWSRIKEFITNETQANTLKFSIKKFVS